MTAAIILAAGAASRMGTLKQLLPYRGKTLIQHAIDEAVEARFDPIVVVVGSGADEIRNAIVGPVAIVENMNWETGMGSSIVAGMRALPALADTADAVTLLAADQPLVEGRHLAAMRELFVSTGAEIVAAEYRGTVGVPALFGRKWFEALTALPPEAGARVLLRTPEARVTRFPLPEAALDLDTREDFERLTSAVPDHRT